MPTTSSPTSIKHSRKLRQGAAHDKILATGGISYRTAVAVAAAHVRRQCRAGDRDQPGEQHAGCRISYSGTPILLFAHRGSGRNKIPGADILRDRTAAPGKWARFPAQ